MQSRDRGKVDLHGALFAFPHVLSALLPSLGGPSRGRTSADADLSDGGERQAGGEGEMSCLRPSRTCGVRGDGAKGLSVVKQARKVGKASGDPVSYLSCGDFMYPS